MAKTAIFSGDDKRRWPRFQLGYRLRASCGSDRIFDMYVLDVSAGGFLASFDDDLPFGREVAFELPCIGVVEAVQIWSRDQQAGFCFARPVREDLVYGLVAGVRPSAMRTSLIQIKLSHFERQLQFRR